MRGFLSQKIKQDNTVIASGITQPTMTGLLYGSYCNNPTVIASEKPFI
jgi:hypothetical protein